VIPYDKEIVGMGQLRFLKKRASSKGGISLVIGYNGSMRWIYHTALGVIVALLVVSIVLLLRDTATISGGTWFQITDTAAPTVRLEHNGVYFLQPKQNFTLVIGTRQSRARLPFMNVRFPDNWLATGGTIATKNKRSFACSAPKEPGRFEVEVSYEIEGSQARDRLLFEVMTPFKQVVEQYPRTYRYPVATEDGAPHWVKSHAAAYAEPTAFFTVTEAVRQREILPGYRVDEFVCATSPQDATPVPFAVLSPLLVEKLRLLTLRLIKEGIISQKLTILEGYRSPRYNEGVRHAQPFSRHIYGDALTFIVDEDGDGVMDDLNGDGRRDREDARVIARLIHKMTRSGELSKGGIGIHEYRRDGEVEQVDLHIDCRGYTSVWGVSRSGTGSATNKTNFTWWK
jgi:hypothetical protein